MEEHLLLKLILFAKEVYSEFVSRTKIQAVSNIITHQPSGPKFSESRCYFGTLLIDIGDVSLSASTVDKSFLSSDLKKIKKKHNITLVGFEGALVSFPKFQKLFYDGIYSDVYNLFLQCYIDEIRRQKFNIFVSMDAIGNPRGFASDVGDSIQTFLFEGNVGGSVLGIGYGVTKSISKVASSFANGLGSLTFDERHEQLRRRMLRSRVHSADGSGALTHLYGGVKGLGVGLFGGLAAIPKNTITATREDGITGIFRGFATGALDTVTRPLQGAFDLIEGTASAMKEVVGVGIEKRTHFAEYQSRLPRVCVGLQSLLVPYSKELAEAQQELLRINLFSTTEKLLAVIDCLNYIRNGLIIVHRALIASEQCYIVKQVNGDPAQVIQRIVYNCLRSIQEATTQVHKDFTLVEVIYNDLPRTNLYCNDQKTAARLCKKIRRAKQLQEKVKKTATFVTSII